LIRKVVEKKKMKVAKDNFRVKKEKRPNHCLFTKAEQQTSHGLQGPMS
jgi:hypothetical protein